MLLHICFVDYHAEMKFEQLLKIICKRYFLFFAAPAPLLLVCLSETGASAGIGVSVNTVCVCCPGDYFL